MPNLRKWYTRLGATPAERLTRGLLLLTVTLMPLSVVWLLPASQTEVGGLTNPFVVPVVYLQEALMLAAVGAWWWARRPRAAIWLPYGWLLPVLGLAVITAAWASSTDLALTGAGHLTVAFLWMVALATELRSPIFGRWAAWLFVASCCLQAVFGLAQFASGADLGLRMLGEAQLSATKENVAKVAYDGEKHIRAYGTFSHPNVLAAYLVTAIFFLGTVVFWPYRAATRLRALASPAALLLLTIGLVVTFSRVALLITVVNGALVILFSYRRWRRLPAAAAIVAVGFFLTLAVFWPENRTTLDTSEETGAINRAVGYELAGQMITDRPFGVGQGNFVLAAEELNGSLPGYQYQPAHNVPLLIATELGIIASLLVTVFLVRVGLAFHRLRPSGRRANTLNFSLFCLAGTFIAMAMTDHFFWSQPQGLWLAVFVTAAIVSRIPLQHLHPRG